MKKITILLLAVIGICSLNWQCASPAKGTTISGQVTNAGNLQLFLDKIYITTASETVAKTDIDANGSFSLNMEEGVDKGIYRIRIGQQRFNLIMDGTEKEVKINGDLNTLSRYTNLAVEGSSSTSEYIDMMQKIMARQVKLDDVTAFLKESSTLGALSVAQQALGANASVIDTHKAVLARVEADMPNSIYAKDFKTFVSSIEAQARASAGPINVGQMAPDIDLPNPDGKNYKLSDLKGNVVLLDFWASWCGPCRRENPNVVKIYNKYKDKGFTVYSVSLDGADARSIGRFGGDQERIAQYTDSQKKRWEDAIKKDGLIWPYHVSDLKKWSCAPAQAYGVRGIPKTFLIDKEGKIAKVGLRGAAQIEAELLKLL